MKKISSLVLIILFVIFIYAVSDTVENFNDRTNPFSVEIPYLESNIEFIDLPIGLNILNFTIVINETTDGLIGCEGNSCVNLRNEHLIRWWRMNGTSNTTLIDYSDNKISLQLIKARDGAGNVTDMYGIENGAYQFDRSRTMYAENTTESPDIAGNVNNTFNVWVRLNVSSFAQQYIFSCITGAATSMIDSQYVLASQELYFSVFNHTSQYTTIKAVVTDPTNWHMYTYVMNGSDITIYINGRFNITGNVGTERVDTCNRFQIGTEQSAIGVHDLDGNVSDFSVWNRPLNGDEIEYLYRGGLRALKLDVANVNHWTDDNTTNISERTEIPINLLLPECDCTGCIQLGDNCRIPINFSSVGSGILNVLLFNLTYGFEIDDCSVYTHQIFNMSYYDQASGASISLDNGYDLNFNSGGLDQSISGTFASSTQDEFCTNVDPAENNISIDLSGTFTLTKTDYATKLYEFDPSIPITLNNSNALNISMFLVRLNESTTVVFTWLTQSYDAIDGIMEIYECNGDGSRTLVESTPIVNGEAIANIELLTKTYSYEVIIAGERFTDEDSYTKCHIESQETRQFIVDVTGTDISERTGMYLIPCIVNRTGNNTVMVTWGTNPDNDDEITGCIYAYRHSVAGTDEVYVNCSTVSPIERTIPASGFDYSVTGRLFQSGFSIDCIDIVEFKSDVSAARIFGLSGIMSIFFLIVGLVLLWSESGIMQQLAAIIGLILGFILGFLAFGWQTIAAMIFFVIIVMLVGRHSRKPE